MLKQLVWAVIIFFGLISSAQAVTPGTYSLIVTSQAPQITSYWNSENGTNQPDIIISSFPKTISFNISFTSNISYDSNISWKVNGVEYQNTTTSNFTHIFNTSGTYNVTSQVFNNNISSQILSIYVRAVVSIRSQVRTGASGGNDYLQPTETPPEEEGVGEINISVSDEARNLKDVWSQTPIETKQQAAVVVILFTAVGLFMIRH